MGKLKDFKQSLDHHLPDSSFGPQLTSLWYDGKGNWKRAHDQVDHLGDQDSACVHAYLHRKEGDLNNADYWYRKAGKERPGIPLDEEWQILVEHFLMA